MIESELGGGVTTVVCDPVELEPHEDNCARAIDTKVKQMSCLSSHESVPCKCGRAHFFCVGCNGRTSFGFGVYYYLS